MNSLCVSYRDPIHNSYCTLDTLNILARPYKTPSWTSDGQPNLVQDVYHSPDWAFPGEPTPVLGFGPRVGKPLDYQRAEQKAVYTPDFGQTFSGAATTLGAAALLNPGLAVPAAVAGIGLGVYGVGKGLKIW